jgi:hypothetical protein
MKRTIIFMVAGIFVLAAMSSVWAVDQATMSKVERVTKEEIVALAKDTIVVDAVKEANKTATKSLDEIIKLDKRWRATDGVDAWIGGFLNNPCATYLKEVQNEHKKGGRFLYSEIFVMDKQGNIVAESNKTSDYWQGDEAKFTKSFADGKGAIFIDKPSFDESTQTYLVQVSVPVLDPYTGGAIGAMTVGVNLEALE